MIDLDIARNNLFDSYGLNFGRRMREIIKGADNEEKLEVNHFLTLRNLFLIRRLADPGFRVFIIDEILKSPKALQQGRQKIIELCKREESGRDFEFQGLIKKKQDEEEIPPFRVPIPDLDVENILLGNCPLPPLTTTTEFSKKFLEEQRSIALENGDLDLLVACNWMLAEMVGGAHSSHLLFTNEDFFKGAAYTYTWQQEAQRYIFLKIRYSELYDKVASRKDYLIDVLLLNDTRLSEAVFADLTEEAGRDLGSIHEWGKFLNDAISIVSVMWFDNKGEKEKLELLNRFYPLDLKTMLGTVPDIASRKEYLLRLEQLMFRAGYYYEAIDVLEALLRSEVDRSTSFLCNDGIATCYRQLGEHDRALPYYLRAMELSDDNGTPGYGTAVACKNVAETYAELGETGLASKHLDEAEKMAANLDVQGKVGILVNIACVHRRSMDFQKELSYLVKAVKIGGDHPSTAMAHNRLVQLNSPEFRTSNLKLNLPALMAYEQDTKVSKFGDRAYNALLSFQFQAYHRWIGKALEVREEPDVILGQSQTYFQERDLDAALAGFARLCKYDPKGPVANALTSLIYLSKDKETEARQLIEEELSYLWDNDLDWDRYLDILLRESIRLKRTRPLLSIINSIELDASKENEKSYVPITLGREFGALGFVKDAALYYKKAFELATTKEFLAETQCELGDIYEGWSMLIDAHDMYLDALQNDPESVKALVGIAKCFARIHDFTNATRSVEVATRIQPDNELLIQLMHIYGPLTEEVLSIVRIKDDDVRKSLAAADGLLLNPVVVKGMGTSSDYSHALVEYAKALEIMLDKHVSQKIREVILEEIGERVDDLYWKGNKTIHPLPYGLKVVLGTNHKQLGVGEWEGLFDDLAKPTNNSVTILARAEFEKILDSKGKEIIRKACGALKKLRNSSAHSKTMTREEVLANRRQIIFFMNLVIDYIYWGGTRTTNNKQDQVAES